MCGTSWRPWRLGAWANRRGERGKWAGWWRSRSWGSTRTRARDKGEEVVAVVELPSGGNGGCAFGEERGKEDNVRTAHMAVAGGADGRGPRTSERERRRVGEASRRISIRRSRWIGAPGGIGLWGFGPTRAARKEGS